jgi:hypothetical protein
MPNFLKENLNPTTAMFPVEISELKTNKRRPWGSNPRPRG